MTPNTGEDLSAAIQRVIDENPNKTIYFPDGIYTIASPIVTPALPALSVSLKLSDQAVIKASKLWDNKCTDPRQELNGTYNDAMVQL